VTQLGRDMQKRYGDWYTGSELDLDTTLLEYNHLQDARLQKAAVGSRRRKSAFPTLAHGTSGDEESAANQVCLEDVVEGWNDHILGGDTYAFMLVFSCSLIYCFPPLPSSLLFCLLLRFLFPAFFVSVFCFSSFFFSSLSLYRKAQQP
jgi:hypothetical protein